jgi:hypothetical protein
MATYPTKLAEAFASKALEIYYANSVSEEITNQDYEGEIRDKSSILNILTFSKILSHTYTGADMTADTLSESNAQLVTNQAKDFYFLVKSYDKFRSYIKNPEGTILSQTALEIKKVIDTYVLTFWNKVAAGNRIGTDYTTGTASVSAAGVVTGVGTTWTSAMEGKPFQILGQTEWYLIDSVNSGTELQIYDDLDDTGTGAYTGGAVGGTTYIIQAASPVQVTASTIFAQLGGLKVKLDKLGIPAENRFVVLPPDITDLVTQNANFNPSGVPSAYEKMSINGLGGNGRVGGTLKGFEVFQSPYVAGSGTNDDGWHIIAGHKSAITFAMAFVETGMEDAIGNFGKKYKSLNVYGAKVPDERRKALAELFAKL